MIDFKKQLDNAEKRLKTNKADKKEVGSDNVSEGAIGEIGDDEDILLGVEELEENEENGLKEIQQLLEQDKEFCFPEECDNETGKDTEILRSSTLAAKKKLFDYEDKIFFSTYNKLQSKLWKYHDKGQIDMYVEYLKTKQETLLTCRDHLQRTLLHFAIEQDNLPFAECLMSAGLNPNAAEQCGATPSTIAVGAGSLKLCKLLVASGSAVRGPTYVGIPDPIEMAKKLEMHEIYELLNPDDSDFEDEDIRAYDPVYAGNSQTVSGQQHISVVSEKPTRLTPGFVTGVVGDAGTCRINRSVMERAPAFSWIGVIPGDLHTKGAVIEACFKEQGPCGFHHLVKNVLNRQKLRTEVFKEKKFEQDNYRQIREAVRDCSLSYCIAAAYEFKQSDHFPDPVSLRSCLKKHGSHNKVILESFHRWIKMQCNENIAFNYQSRMFLYYGPLLDLFDYSNHHNFGIGREIVYMLLLPTFGQLGFRNYYGEVFCHVANFVAKWPLAFRRLLQQNCCINLSGKSGKGIELDSWVESRVVKATKNYVSGHATVKTCTRLGGSIDVISMIKDAYRGKEAFDDHTTTRHSVSSPLPDQLKGAWFCVNKQLFTPTVAKNTEVTGMCSTETVPQSLLDVEQKGCQKLKTNFKKKMYDLFPDVRYEE